MTIPFIFIITIIVILILIWYKGSNENLFPGYPVYIQQPFENQGWGFRDQEATKQTLLADQDQPLVLMPDSYPQPDFPYHGLVGYRTHLVESAPVPEPQAHPNRPPNPQIQQRQVSSTPYASW